MRLNAIAVALASVASVTAALPSWASKGSQSVIASDDEELNVPGENPLKYCQADRTADIVSIKRVDLDPNPPTAGTQLVIAAVGTVFEPIEEGAYINLVVKYGLIKLVSTKADFCEQSEKADLKCPIEKGVLAITKAVDIPNEVPPGKYTVHAEVINADGKPITCLEATVVFGPDVFSFEL